MREKKFSMQPTNILVGRAASRRSMRIRNSSGNSDVSRTASIAVSHSANVFGSMSRSSALGRPGKPNLVTAIRVLAHGRRRGVMLGNTVPRQGKPLTSFA